MWSKSKIWTMLACCSLAARRASLMNMRTKSGSSLKAGRIRLMTRSLTKPSAPRVSAAKTSAMPPEPSRRRSSYLPNRSPNSFPPRRSREPHALARQLASGAEPDLYYS